MPFTPFGGFPSPQAECAYDEGGNLTGPESRYSDCRGTDNDFPWYDANHYGEADRGGTAAWGDRARRETLHHEYDQQHPFPQYEGKGIGDILGGYGGR